MGKKQNFAVPIGGHVAGTADSCTPLKIEFEYEAVDIGIVKAFRHDGQLSIGDYRQDDVLFNMLKEIMNRRTIKNTYWHVGFWLRTKQRPGPTERTIR